ncbi:MAG: ketoacyl-ACP synthase III [Spirochaetes bacterium]|nr:ketoacyl-ACP synthase III [Spirochaetota bacterium]
MIYIHGCGHFRPENTITNQFLTELDIGTNESWILERTGIHERKTILDLEYIQQTKNANPLAAKEASLYTNAQTGASAAEMAIARAGITKEEIGLVISGSCTPQSCCPAEACTIANQLEIEVPCFDLNSACSTIGMQMNFINTMQPDKLPQYILLVQPENNTRHIDYRDRSTAVLWGDCSTAVVVSTQIPSPFRIQHSMIQSSPAGQEKVVFDINGHFRQDGKSVQKFAIRKSVALIEHFKQFIEPEKINQVKMIGHQANLVMLNSIVTRTNINPENHYFNINKYGNCGAAGSVSVLSENIEQFKTGDNIIVAVVGSGLTWTGFLIEVA